MAFFSNADGLVNSFQPHASTLRTRGKIRWHPVSYLVASRKSFSDICFPTPGTVSFPFWFFVPPAFPQIHQRLESGPWSRSNVRH